MSDYGEFCILIPTRNRPREVEKLLTSIQASTIKPVQVIIVSSGEEISDVMEKFALDLEITYIHSEISGQINQKKLGISAINPRAKWVVFMDDDLLVFPDTFEQAFGCIYGFSRDAGRDLAGIGFGLPVTSRFNNGGKFSRRVARLFGIDNQPAGYVLSNGHATSYLEQQSAAETTWLNGASMWRVDKTSSYGSHGISSSYAACEDLIFSYPLGKTSSLVYCPNAKLDFQVVEKTNFENPSIYMAALYWRYFFVLEHQEFSILRFNLAQLGRLIFGITQNSEDRIKFFSKAVPATLRVAVDSLYKKEPRKFLESI
jgi:glycosyltransferase involved in cell wall biosynthesis